MGFMPRQILIVEIDSPNIETAEARIVAALPDAVVWGEADPASAALLILNAHFDALAA